MQVWVREQKTHWLLLETEVKKLETLSPLKPEGGIAMEKAEQLQKEVEKIQLKLYKSNSDSLLSQLKKRALAGHLARRDTDFREYRHPC